MAPQERDHNSIVREEFTRQADAYASAPVITNEQRIARLVTAIRPDRDSRAIEVATGPGYVAMALAAQCREVVGIDLTDAPLAIADRMRRERGVDNVTFRSGDAEALPFADGEFDIAVCRFAFHHFERPERVLGEMCRVCRAGGTIAIEDLYASENPERAAYWNHLERLRDHSHTRALALGELLAMAAGAAIEIVRLYSDELTTDAESWIASTQTIAADAGEIRRLIEDDMRRDLSGIQPFIRNGKLSFNHRTVALIGRKLAG